MKWLVMKSKDIVCKMPIDAYEVKEGDMVYAYRKAPGALTADEFAGCFDLGSVDFLYLTEERE